MDFTFLDCSLEGAPDSGHYLLILIDTFNNYIIYSKVFFLRKKRGTITTEKLIKCLQQTINRRGITQELILNADRGSEFVSKKYYQFVSEHPFLEGSHSGPATPNHNAVVERMNRTFKTQTQQYPMPKTVAKTRDLQRFVDKKTHFLNNQFIHKRNEGNTANEEMSKNLAKMAATLNDVNKNTTPKTKISHKAQIARDPLPETVYEAILNDKKPVNAHRLTWARFRVTSTVLFYTGLRVNEICYMTL